MLQTSFLTIALLLLMPSPLGAKCISPEEIKVTAQVLSCNATTLRVRMNLMQPPDFMTVNGLVMRVKTRSVAEKWGDLGKTPQTPTSYFQPGRNAEVFVLDGDEKLCRRLLPRATTVVLKKIVICCDELPLYGLCQIEEKHALVQVE